MSPYGDTHVKECTITPAMARAAVEDGVPLFALVWVHYKITENAALSGWFATVRCPKDLWTPLFEEFVSEVVE